MAQINIETQFLGESLRSRAEELMPSASETLQALRDKSCAGSEWTGWWDYPAINGFKLQSEIQAFKDQLEVPYDAVLVIGIGGSYLGTRAVYEALSHSHKGLVNDKRPILMFAGHHVSEAALIETLDLLDQRLPLVNVISKSGTTTEPSVAFRVIRNYMNERFGEKQAAERIIVTTDKEKGALRQLANDSGYKSFEVPNDIGGRFSVLSAVGQVPLALAGFDTRALMEGADAVFKELMADDLKSHPALEYACARMAAYEADKRIELMSYISPKLFYITEWWKQLFGESEGKDGKGLFPAALAYTTDLHSLGQYAQDGVRNILETFLHFEKESASGDQGGVERFLRVPHTSDNLDELGYLESRSIEEVNKAAMLATKVAHYDGGVPCITLTASELNEKAIGSLFAFFETACTVSGLLLGVNPFDQPGVEAYKKNLFGLLGKPGFEELGSQLRKRL